jgi:hypothetical protein
MNIVGGQFNQPLIFETQRKKPCLTLIFETQIKPLLQLTLNFETQKLDRT